jgi:aldose 1-epimerase
MRLDLAPAIGGAIAGWWHGDLPVLRPAGPNAAGAFTVREHASFPLIPFSNRIGEGKFSFGGETFTLPRDARDPRHALHGNALYAAWTVGEIRPGRARLTLDYRPGQPDVPFFPFAYHAMQHFCLRPDGLRICISLRNTDTRPFPAGLGHHLYFPIEDATVLRFQSGGHWTNGPDGLPAAIAHDVARHFAAGAAIGGQGFDHCFFGWDGRAGIVYPQTGHSLRLRASAALRHAVLYVPEGGQKFAFEPVSHATDAVNRPQGGMHILAPGQTLAAAITLRLGAGHRGTI